MLVRRRPIASVLRKYSQQHTAVFAGADFHNTVMAVKTVPKILAQDVINLKSTEKHWETAFKCQEKQQSFTRALPNVQSAQPK